MGIKQSFSSFWCVGSTSFPSSVSIDLGRKSFLREIYLRKQNRDVGLTWNLLKQCLMFDLGCAAFNDVFWTRCLFVSALLEDHASWYWAHFFLCFSSASTLGRTSDFVPAIGLFLLIQLQKALKTFLDKKCYKIVAFIVFPADEKKTWQTKMFAS